jgi:hypothetical protein
MSGKAKEALPSNTLCRQPRCSPVMHSDDEVRAVRPISVALQVADIEHNERPNEDPRHVMCHCAFFA